MPWVFLEKRESLFIIVSRVLLAEELVGESETCQARGLGTRQAQEVRGGGATTDPMAMSEQRASPKHRPLSPKTQNQKPQAKTYKSVTERHQMHLVSTREKRGELCSAGRGLKQMTTQKKKKLVGTRPFTSRSVQNQSASNCTLARDMSFSLFQFQFSNQGRSWRIISS